MHDIRKTLRLNKGNKRRIFSDLWKNLGVWTNRFFPDYCLPIIPPSLYPFPVPSKLCLRRIYVTLQNFTKYCSQGLAVFLMTRSIHRYLGRLIALFLLSGFHTVISCNISLLCNNICDVYSGYKSNGFCAKLLSS